MTWQHVAQRLPDHQRRSLPPSLPESLPALEQCLIAMLDSGAPYGAAVMAGIIALMHREVLASYSAGLVTLLRKLQCRWDVQGRPCDLEGLDLTVLTARQLSCLRGLLMAAEKAMIPGIPTVWNGEDIQKLDPQIFVRALGWQNLRKRVSSGLLHFAEQRSKLAAGPLAAELRPLLVFLFGQRGTWFCSYLVMAAAVVTGEQLNGMERNTPLSVLNYIKHVAAFFRRTTLVPGYSAELLDRAIGAMVQIGGVSARDSSISGYVNDYMCCVEAEHRWMAEQPPELRALSGYLLPAPTWPVDVKARFYETKCAQRTRRHEQVRAFMPFVKPLGHQVLARAAVFRALGEVYLTALKRANEQGVQHGPVPFELCLADGSATLRFALWRPAELMPDHMAGSRRWDNISDHWLTEYLGAEHAGAALPLPFFAVLQRAWHDPAARAALIAAGTLKSDLEVSPSGLLRPEKRRSAYVTALTMAAVQRNEPPRMLFDLQSLCTGASVGALFFLLAIDTGMRIHELQQIRMDETFISDPQPKVPEAAFTVWVYLKGQKGLKAQLKAHQIDGAHKPLWRDVLAWLGRTGDFSREAVLEYGALHRLKPGSYLFQFGGQGMRQVMLLKLLRFISFGLKITDTNGQVVSLATHVLRHLNVRVRGAQNHSATRVQRDMGHANRADTEHYFGPRDQRGSAEILGAIEPLTLWQSLLPKTRPVIVQLISGEENS